VGILWEAGYRAAGSATATEQAGRQDRGIDGGIVEPMAGCSAAALGRIGSRDCGINGKLLSNNVGQIDRRSCGIDGRLLDDSIRGSM
jgi:hypothetical protein